MSRSFLKYNSPALGAFFLLVAIPCLIGSFFLAKKSYTFVAEGKEAEGIVIKLDSQQRTGKNSPRIVYAPIYTFETPDKASHTIRSSHWTSKPGYTEGDHVRVLYQPKTPEVAIIRSFSELWLTPLFLVLFSFAFGAAGIGMILKTIRQHQLQQWLVQHGQRIVTHLEGIDVNRSLKVNGRSPYILISCWKDPTSGIPYTFTSEDLWDDPTSLVAGRTSVDVLIKPGEPKKYWMDISFIPNS